MKTFFIQDVKENGQQSAYLFIVGKVCLHLSVDCLK